MTLAWQNEDYYALLGITRMAGDDDIRKAFRHKAKHCHPDRFPLGSVQRVDADRLFKELTAARDTLLDPIKRQAYDNELLLLQQAHFDAIIYEPPPNPEPPKQPSFNKVSSFLDNLKQAYNQVQDPGTSYSFNEVVGQEFFASEEPNEEYTKPGGIPEYSKRNAAAMYYAQGMRYAARGNYRRALYALNNAKMLDPACTPPEHIMRKIKMQAFFR